MNLLFAITIALVGCSDPPPQDPEDLFHKCSDLQDNDACLLLSEVPGKLGLGTRKIYSLRLLCKRNALEGCKRLYDIRKEWADKTDIQVALGGNCGGGVEAACVYMLNWADEDPSILNENARALTEAKLAEIRAAK